MTDLNRKDFTVSMGIIIVAIIIMLSIIASNNLINNLLVVENGLLKARLMEYNNTTKIFPAYCIKCYCKDICEEAYGDTGV